MAPRKRKGIGQVQSRSKKAKQQPIAETPEARIERLAKQRESLAKTRASETSEQQEARLLDQRERSTVIRHSETPDEHEVRLLQNRERAAAVRISEPSEHKEGKGEIADCNQVDIQ